MSSSQFTTRGLRSDRKTASESSSVFIGVQGRVIGCLAPDSASRSRRRPPRRIEATSGSAVRKAKVPLSFSLYHGLEAMLNMARDKILIVDDEPSIRRAIRATLLELGFDVEEASTGEQALVLLRGSQYEAMLLDINMPGMGGIEACRQIRQISPHAAILMLSVRDSEDDKVEALEAGADDYVTKPFHVRELVARVRAAIRRARLPQRDASSVISIGDIALDPAGRVVHRRG